MECENEADEEAFGSGTRKRPDRSIPEREVEWSWLDTKKPKPGRSFL